MIVLCIVLIGLGPSTSSNNYDMPNLMLSIAFAVITGVLFTVNYININYIIKTIGFPTDQLNYDGGIAFSVVLIPFFIYELMNDRFTAIEIVNSNMAVFCVTLAIIFMSYGL